MFVSVRAFSKSAWRVRQMLKTSSESPSRFSKMPHNGFHLWLQEQMAMGLIAQGSEFFHNRGQPFIHQIKVFTALRGAMLGL